LLAAEGTPTLNRSVGCQWLSDEILVNAKLVSDKDKGLQCELCDEWFHVGCVDVSDEVYKTLTKNEHLHWFCVKCNGSFRKVINSIAKLVRISVMESV